MAKHRMRKFKSKRYKRLVNAIAKAGSIKLAHGGREAFLKGGLSAREKSLFKALDEERSRLWAKGLDPT